MRLRIATCGVLSLALTSTTLPAQSSPTAAPDDRLDRFERRLNDIESRHQQDLRARDEEIARLRQELANVRQQQQQQQQQQPAPTTRPVGTAGAAAPSSDEVERTRQEILRDIESGAAAPVTNRIAASLNPDVAVIIDSLGTWSSQRGNNAYNRFDVREAELDLRAAIDPRADGVLVLAFERDVHNPPFPEPGEDEEEGVESRAGIEEAYAFFHDFGVPNLTAKLGRFHLRFGRQNVLHLHDLPTSDPPLVNQAFLAPEALIDSGLSLSYAIPPRLVGGQYVELVAEVVTGEGGESESPTLTGDISVDSPALNLHALWNGDLARHVNLELGASWLSARRSADNGQNVNLFGLDATLLRSDPMGKFNNQLLQAEVMHAVVDQADGGATQHAWGAYLLGQQQLSRDWYAGLRLDWTQDPNDDDAEAWAVSPYVSWYLSEFLRLRLEYQHRNGDADAADVVYFQATYIFGAHPPHPYWAMK